MFVTIRLYGMKETWGKENGLEDQIEKEVIPSFGQKILCSCRSINLFDSRGFVFIRKMLNMLSSFD